MGDKLDQLDLARLHFVGKLPYPAFVSLLQISRAHIYLSYPFVLSWSLLEAMALGAPVVASDTAPVREIIQHEQNGLLFDFFDREALVSAVCRVLDDQALSDSLTQAARQTVIQNYDLNQVCLPAQVKLIDQLAQGSEFMVRGTAG